MVKQTQAFQPKKILTTCFWLVFFCFFLLFTIPNLISYATNGLPEYMGETLLHNQIRFIIHAFFGTIVYVTAYFQFNSNFRNKNIKLHRNLGKVYILSSLVCIVTLALMIPEGLCVACRPSHYIVTSLWLFFILAAYYSIRRRNIESHRRLMISSFICAAYFVSVRIIDLLAMPLFYAFFENEDLALLASDLTVWALPLFGFWFYWLILKK